MENESKLRLLYTARILNELTDENNPLSTVQIIDILKERYGISTHRTTVAKDMEILREYGIDIYKIESTQNKYFVANREFELPELRLLIDAVESSKFITEKKSKKLIAKIAKLASVNQSAMLRSTLCTEPRLRPANEKIYYIIDAVHEAINKGKRVAFQYFYYDENKCRCLKHDGEFYVFSPYTLVWNGDYYYMVGYSEKHKEIGCFRVDRVADVPQIMDEDAIAPPAEFEVSRYLKTVSRMYNSEERDVELICDNSTMDSLIDHFGVDIPVSKYNENAFKTTVRTAVSPIFMRWVFGFSGEIRIVGPADVKTKYAKMVRCALEGLGE